MTVLAAERLDKNAPLDSSRECNATYLAYRGKWLLESLTNGDKSSPAKREGKNRKIVEKVELIMS